MVRDIPPYSVCYVAVVAYAHPIVVSVVFRPHFFA